MPNTPSSSHTTPSRPLTWLITGCSSGVGLSLTRHVLLSGHHAIATSRNPSKTPSYVDEITSFPRGRWIKLDVTSPRRELDATITAAWDLFGDDSGIDLVVNNAAYSVLGALEDVSEAQVEAQFPTNFQGVLKVCQAVLPGDEAEGKWDDR